MMKQLSVVVAAMTLAWLAPGQVEAQPRCQGSVDCGPGWVCAGGQCAQEGSVTVQVGAGAVGALLSVTDQAAQLSVTDPGVQLSVTDPVGQQGDEQAPQPHPVEYVERRVLNPSGPAVALLWSWVFHIMASSVMMTELEERGSPIASDFGPATFVPLAGPWIQLGLTQSVGDDWWAPWLVFSGMTHTGSLLFVILGLVLTKRVAASADLGNGVHLAVSPGIGSLSASLTF